MKYPYEYSKKEQKLIETMKMQDIASNPSMVPALLYYSMAIQCFRENRNDVISTSVRNCLLALEDCTRLSNKSPLRLTHGFDDLITLEEDNTDTVYLDSVHGYSYLVNRSNELYNLRKHEDKPSFEEEILKKFERCYFTGSESSSCGRTCISHKKLLQNISNVISQSDSDKLGPYKYREFLEKAFEGIYDNISLTNDGKGYRP